MTVPPPKKKQTLRTLASIAAGFVAGALVIHLWFQGRPEGGPAKPRAVQQRPGAATQTDFKPTETPVIDLEDTEVLRQTDEAISKLARAVTPAVVNVFTSRTITVQSPLMNDPFFKHFFQGRIRPQSRKSQSLGSGVFVTEDGYIASAYHVVEGAEAIQILTHDGRMFEAAVTGSEPRSL